MTDIAIRVDNLSKLYHLSAPSPKQKRIARGQED